MTKVTFNCDSSPIKNYDVSPRGFMKLWSTVAVANKNLNYDEQGQKRVEYITEPDLFYKPSIDSLVGAPVTINHRPGSIDGKNYKYAVGTMLQEFTNIDGCLAMATIIYDKEVIKKIQNKDIRYTSSAYYSDKELQKDGRYRQFNRYYNHVSGLTESHAPRAGEQSRFMYWDSENMQDEQKEQETKPSLDSVGMGELVELWTKFKPVLEKYGKQLDYSLDSDGVKRLILSCFYPEKAMNRLNRDSNLLQGVWWSFEMEESMQRKQEQVDSARMLESQADSTSSRDRYIQRYSVKGNK